VKFLVDAQLPRRLAVRLRELGYDALHTLDLPDRNRTPDREVNVVALREGRVVITKDNDFVNSFLLLGEPNKLLMISTGNITNADLESLLFPVIPAIVSALQDHRYIELTRTALILHV
jgi:predicted nuclease of predicted toxin-antitoxin system